MKKHIKLLFKSFLLVGIFLCSAISVLAMSSSSYKIDADSLNAGGNEGSSSSFKLNDTVGEFAIGEGSSASYISKAGFQYMVNTYLTLTLDSSSKDLGSLLPGSPITGQTTATVSTDAWNGYAINVSKNHLMQHTDTTTQITDHAGSISTPLLWSSPNHQGFGFTIISGVNRDADKWGNTPDFKYAAFPALATTAYSKSGYQSTGDQTVFGYKVDVASNQKSGAYSCIVTYTAVASL